jgi:DNA invertase Pin-like site-specific DNA recombinase
MLSRHPPDAGLLGCRLPRRTGLWQGSALPKRTAFVDVYTDLGISGAKGRDKRPGLDRLMKAVGRREIDLVTTWSVDRLGRSLQDLLAVLGDIHGKGADLYLHQQGIDTRTPGGKAFFRCWASLPSSSAR